MQTQRLLSRYTPITAPMQLARCNVPLCRRQQHALRAAAADTQQPELAAQNPLDNLFQDLCKHFGITSSVLLKHSDGGSGLFAVEPIAKGDIILRVPRSLCIIIDNEAGSMTIPPGSWPRLSGGLMQPGEPLTWDLLEALAMMDATAGDGDQFWELYADQVLPQPEDLTLPMCWPPELLQQLQHPAIIEAALQQQERLRTLLPPEYMQPIDDGLPSYLQWGFACVRSRACQVGPQAFGMVPFLDLANHAADPTADLRASGAVAVPPAPSSSGSDGGSGSSSDSSDSSSDSSDSSSDSSSSSMTSQAVSQDFIDLVALRDVAAGAEVTITYSGVQGYTNQRFMAQYGFVPVGGNMADRLDLAVPERLAGVKLRMSHLESALGSGLILHAARGQNPYIFAALKSLPLQDDAVDPAAEAAAAEAAATAAATAGTDSSSSSSSGSGRGMGPATEQEQELAAALLQQIQADLEACGTSVQEDEQLLEQLLQSPGSDARLVAAVRYRLERKRLLQVGQVLLNTFTRS